jgi:GAF domain-containing protein
MRRLVGSHDSQNFRGLFAGLQKQDYFTALTKILHAAITITSADKGNIQLLDPLSRSLHIAVHEGFREPFLQFFAEVNHRSAACGTAMTQLKRVVVKDVRQSLIFIGTEALDVLLEAGVQAVQSTPLITKNGYFVGIISTHYGVPTLPTQDQLRLLDELAVFTAEFIGEPQQQPSVQRNEIGSFLSREV